MSVAFLNAVELAGYVGEKRLLAARGSGRVFCLFELRVFRGAEDARLRVWDRMMCVVWGAGAEVVMHLEDGTLMLLRGALRVRRNASPDGELMAGQVYVLASTVAPVDAGAVRFEE